MRIAMTHVDLPNESKGGVAFQVHYLANALAERGHAVTMFTFSPACPDCRYRVRRYPIAPRLRRFKAFLLAGYLARTDFSRFDVLHTHGDNYLLRGRHPQIRTFYGSAKDEAGSAVTLRRRVYQSLTAVLEQRGAQVADVNVGISEATRARIPAVSAVVPCGVDVRLFRPGPKADKPAVLFVGTSGGRKRGAFLADIFTRQVRPRFPEAELWAVTERPLEGDGIVNFGKAPLAKLTGLFRRAWVFCLPSTYEGFGVPYIEAMASGTAVVASPNPGACEVLCEGAFGVLAEDGRLGANINDLLGDAAKREAYAAKGLVRAEDFTWERVAGRYEQLYSALTARRAASKVPGPRVFGTDAY
jgi:glycosyltransferase involved in cell wall biosynthesis